MQSEEKEKCQYYTTRKFHETEQNQIGNIMKGRSNYIKHRESLCFQNHGCKRGSKRAKFSSLRAFCVN